VFADLEFFSCDCSPVGARQSIALGRLLDTFLDSLRNLAGVVQAIAGGFQRGISSCARFAAAVFVCVLFAILLLLFQGLFHADLCARREVDRIWSRISVAYRALLGTQNECYIRGRFGVLFYRPSEDYTLVASGNAETISKKGEIT
jgi:hypothetical protein